MGYNKFRVIRICFLVFLMLLVPLAKSKAQMICGLVTDKLTDNKLAYVNIWSNNSLWGTITNEEGQFQLDLGQNKNIDTLNISHLGYLPFSVDLSLLRTQDTLKIALVPNSLALNEVVVCGGNRIESANKILKKMRFSFFHDYSPISYEAKGFYRETIKGGGKYLGFGEAVCDFHFEGANKNFRKPAAKYFHTSWFNLLEIRRSDYFIDFGYNGKPRADFQLMSIMGYEKGVIYNMILNNKISRKMEFKILGDTINSNSEQFYILEGIKKKECVSADLFTYQYFELPDRVLLYVSSVDWRLKQVEIFRKPDEETILLPGILVEKRNGESRVTIKYEKHNGYSKLNFISFRRSFNPLGWVGELVDFEKIEEEATLFLTYGEENLSIPDLEKKYKGQVITDLGIRYLYDPKRGEIKYNYGFWRDYKSLVCSDFDQIKIDLERKSKTPLSQQFRRNTNENFISVKTLIKFKKHYRNK